MPSKAEARGTGKEPDWNRAPPAFIDSSTDSAARSPPANPRLSPPAAASSSAAGRRSACAQGSSPAAGRSSRLKRGGKCSLTPVNEPHRDFHTPPLRDSRLPSRSERCWRYCWLSLVKACSSFTACCSSSSCKTKALTGKNTAKKKKKLKRIFPPTHHKLHAAQDLPLLIQDLLVVGFGGKDLGLRCLEVTARLGLPSAPLAFLQLPAQQKSFTPQAVFRFLFRHGTALRWRVTITPGYFFSTFLVTQ